MIKMTRGGLAHNPQRLATFFAPVQAILQEQSVALTTPFLRALADIWQRLQRCSSAAWRAQLATTLVRGLHAYQWETANRTQGRIPPRAEYIRLRRQTGGWLTEVALVDLLVGHDASPDVLTHPTVITLLETANDLICWSNDLFSLEKEQQTGEIHNLVMIVAHEEGCDLTHARQLVRELHDQRIQDWLASERLLAIFPQERDRQTVAAYAALCRHFLAANWAWSQRTQRYRPSGYRPDVQEGNLGDLREGPLNQASPRDVSTTQEGSLSERQPCCTVNGISSCCLRRMPTDERERRGGGRIIHAEALHDRA